MLEQQILNALIRQGGYLSGQRLSQSLGVSRAAIWKQVEKLRQAGYPIEAVTRKGYRLDPSADVLCQASIEKALESRGLETFIRQVSHTGSIDSTNRWARQGLEKGASRPGLYVATRQTGGRGRRGNHWLSDSDQGLWFTLLLEPELEPMHLGRLTLLVGLAATLALREDYGLAVGIKWPNDILDEKEGLKLAGILSEVIFEDQSARAVLVGMGLNVQQETFPPAIETIATSMQQLQNKAYHRAEVLASILSALARLYPRLNEPEKWLDDYRRHCLTLGRAVTATGRNGSVLHGKALDLDPSGELILQDERGRRHLVRSGEVSIRADQP